MLNWKSLGIGIILAITLFFTFLSYNMGYISALSFFISAFIGGYLVGGSTKTGAIHGVLIGLFGSILSVLILLVLASFYSNNAVSLLSILLTIPLFFIYAVIGSIGGIIGALIKNRLSNGQ
ncbi:MAG: DUF5518 domain-containing protein [Methanobacterium sp.]|uniref:DUF5518 domain-containing protein n=1 Tax=Methanobacterium sp. TaxID=2164 RepID=UPI003D6495C3|nr:DUF5518 domain-containing protein [Methanobacterium sp.]